MLKQFFSFVLGVVCVLLALAISREPNYEQALRFAKVYPDRYQVHGDYVHFLRGDTWVILGEYQSHRYNLGSKEYTTKAIKR